MSLSVRNFFKKISSLAGGHPQARVLLGAFGKCPLWNDHIDPDIGLEGEMGDLKQLLYLDGIRDRGIASWDKASPEQLIPLGHTLVWRRSGSLILARLWYSRDGRDRDDFPLVICAQCDGLPIQWAFDEVLGALQGLESKLKAATTREAFIALVSGTRESLQARAAENPSAREDCGAPGAGMALIANHLARFESGQGLFRVLHVLRDTSPQRLASPPAEAVRVPRCSVSLPESICGWFDTLDAWFHEPLDILFLAPDQADWLDVLVGQPEGSQFVTLRASTKMIPLTTDVDYTLDPTFVTQVKGIVRQ